MATATAKNKTIMPAEVREATLELIRRVESVVEAKAAVAEQAQALVLLAQAAKLPRFQIPVWNEVEGIRHDLTSDEVGREWNQSTIDSVREFLALLDLAMDEGGA